MKKNAILDPALSEALNALAGMVAQHCESEEPIRRKSEQLSSGFLSYDADAIRLLIKYRYMKKIYDAGGRNVCASFVKSKMKDWA